MTQTHKRPRRQQMQKTVEMKSDWSTDSDDKEDDQATKKPIRHDITSDWETEIEDVQETIIKAPLRRPNTIPKVLTSGIRNTL